MTPGGVTLAEWRQIYFGSAAELDTGSRHVVEAGAKTVEAIVAKGEPVYGINTGFGKLASIRIPDGDLQLLQRNLVLSHAAGNGEPLYRQSDGSHRSSEARLRSRDSGARSNHEARGSDRLEGIIPARAGTNHKAQK